jgi:hypothetical protein
MHHPSGCCVFILLRVQDAEVEARYAMHCNVVPGNSGLVSYRRQ